jgi:hypothetical protein
MSSGQRSVQACRQVRCQRDGPDLDNDDQKGGRTLSRKTVQVNENAKEQQED